MDHIKHARLLLLATMALFSVSGPGTSAQFGSGTVLQQQMIDYLNQMMKANAGASYNTATNTGAQTNTAANTGPQTMGPTLTLPPPPAVTTPAPPPPSNHVSTLYQQIMQMTNNMNAGGQATTTSNSIYANPYFFEQTTPPSTVQPATQGTIPFDPWVNQQTSTISLLQNTTTAGTTGTGTQQPFRLTSWEQYQPHPDPWNQNKPTAALPKPAQPSTATMQLMQTYVPLTLQHRMIDAGRTGFIKPTIYFEEHGCVDPRTALPPGTPSPGLVLSCQSAQSQRVCQQVGAAAGTGGEAPAFDMNSFVMKNMPGYKRLLEVCLSPNTMNNIQLQQQMSMMKMFSNMFNRNANTNTHTNTNTGANMMTGGLHPMGGMSGLGSASGQGGWSGATQSGPSGFSNTDTTAQSASPDMFAPTTTMPPTTNPGTQPQTVVDTMPTMMSALNSMFGSQGSTGTSPVSGRRKRQTNGLFSLYQSLFNTGSSPYRTLSSGAATIPTGAYNMNSVASPSSGFGTSGSLLGSQAEALPAGAAHPSGSTFPSTFSAPNNPASLPFGAAAPSADPTTGMNNVFGSLLGGFGGSTSGTGATSAPVPEPDIAQCQQILPMLLAQAGVEGPLGSPEAMEVLVDVRKQMLPFECQEFPTMNFRLCCPGKVAPPTFQEMMMAGANAGA